MFEKIITRYTADELKAHLRNFILQAITLGEESKRLAAKMQPYGCELKPVSGISAADDAIRAWTHGIESQASEEFAGGTGAELKLYHIENLDFPRTVPDWGYKGERTDSMRWDWIQAEKEGLDAQIAVLDKFLATIEFDALETGLKVATNGLADKGKQDAADAIASFIGLVGYARKPTKLKPKGLEFTVGYGGTSEGLERYNFRDLLQKAASDIQTAEEETGITGLSSSLNLMVNDLWNSHGHIDLPSRLQIGIPGILAATVFKNHSQFLVESSRADALLSFVAMYSTRELRDVQNTQGALAL